MSQNEGPRHDHDEGPSQIGKYKNVFWEDIKKDVPEVFGICSQDPTEYHCKAIKRQLVRAMNRLSRQNEFDDKYHIKTLLKDHSELPYVQQLDCRDRYADLLAEYRKQNED